MPAKDPEKRKAAQQRWRAKKRETLGERAGSPDEPPMIPLAPPVAPMPLRNAADALAILAEQINSVRADARATPQVRGRSVAYLIAVALRAVEVANIESRLEAIETVLRGRKT